ncbi:hypothetical protein AB1L88_22435 [Tautonia sp. JC769]|uniref:hypothetical protein n=1 Tax=Tautonia sp. JC769 TaxID=3232135 RepID=UPI003459CE0A
MKRSSSPAWLDDARWYYSLIGEGTAQPVSVFDATGRDEVSDESPGNLRLRLEPRSRYSPRVRILDADGHAAGVIRPEGIIPGLRYAMLRDSDRGPAWQLSVRSLVRKRHTLTLAHGVTWTIDTPFFGTSWKGTVRGIPRLVGIVGPGWWGAWQIWIEPGWESTELLAAVAFLHRQWSHM